MGNILVSNLALWCDLSNVTLDSEVTEVTEWGWKASFVVILSVAGIRKASLGGNGKAQKKGVQTELCEP